MDLLLVELMSGDRPMVFYEAQFTFTKISLNHIPYIQA